MHAWRSWAWPGRWIAVILAGFLVVEASAVHSISSFQSRETLLVTPTTQGMFTLTLGEGSDASVTLEIGYATVNDAARLAVTQRADGALVLAATGTNGVPLARFEQPIVVHLPGEVASGGPVTVVIGWPGVLAPSSTAAQWLVIFDAHGLYALPADAPALDAILYLGSLEHYHPALIAHGDPPGGARFSPSAPRERAIMRTPAPVDGQTGAPVLLPTAARSPRYRDRFIPEDLGNPGGFMLLGWVEAGGLPDVVRALRATIPPDPDLPPPGEPRAPLRLILPFDCAQSWVVSWGYHHSTPQNRFAVDFATSEGSSLPVYAAHAGSVALKRYGTPEQMIDVGFAARVTAEDGITSTVYGHLNPEATLARWGIAPDALPDFEWVEVGTVAQGRMIGVSGRSGYATGPHIHFVLWSWDQSLYQPVPLGPLFEFQRGLAIPAGARDNCADYRR